MKNSHTLADLLDLALEMERRAYAFYQDLENRFADNQEFVSCLEGVKEDEKLHLRVLVEIRDSLPDYRLETPVSEESVGRIRKVLDFIDENSVEAMGSTEDIFDAIGVLEEVEFDVVMEFVGIDEIDFEFSREFLQHESLAHSTRIMRARQCLE